MVGAGEWHLPETFDFEGQEVRFGTIGDGKPMVLIHGTPFSSAVWRRIAPLLGRSRRVYFYDLLGYGQSRMAEGQDVSLGVQNRLFDALLSHWGLVQPDVVAHDFGGTTALRTHLLNEREYASLVLVDPVAMAPWGSPFVQHVRQHGEAFAALPSYLHAALLRAYLSGAAHRALTQEELGIYLEPWLGQRGQPAFYRQIAQMDQRFTDEIEHRYAEVRCPVTILWGENDSWIPVERGHDLSTRIPGARLHVIPGAGHLVQEDAPEAIVSAVLHAILGCSG